MKPRTFWQLLIAGALLALALSRAAEPGARIKRVWTEKAEAVVEVETIGPVMRVVLESSPRLGTRAWEPRAIRYFTNGEPENVTFAFRVALSPNMEILRVRSDLPSHTLPAQFFAGEAGFVSGAQGGPGPGGPASFDSAVGAPSREASPGDARSVVESDIWKLEGDTLFFFNQYRGLQIIDVSVPDAPVITGAYDVAAAGEQMYVLDGSRIVLLARDNCAWYTSSAESRLILLEVRNGVPQVVKEIPVAGQISESRLVGTALYVVANSYQARRTDAKEAQEQWEWGTEVTSYDLSNFAAAERKSSDWVSGYGNVIYATDRYLFVAQTGYFDGFTRSLIHIYDVSAPDGVFTRKSTIESPGHVKDKFKMHLTGETFTTVVQEFGRPQGTYVTTYSLANPAEPRQLAHLKIIENEQLFATRFDGDRLYIVTFFLVDPLWVVDLQDPANPRKVGELEIPGWSTYLQPLGDKLLAIGFDGTNGWRQTAVQLFDVADPANPTLLSKVLIGDQWSSSEANWDEKAFGVLPEHNLLLVPFHSSGTNGWYEGVQLIDLDDGELVKRGIIAQNMAARRATLHRDRILSLSSRELLTVDATNRDRPVVTRKTELSWAADQLHLAGDYVIEVDAYQSDGPILRVVDAADAALVRHTVALTNLPYLGSTVIDSKFYVLQGRSLEHIYPQVYDPNNWGPIQTNPAVYVLSVFDASHLPNLSFITSTQKEGSSEIRFLGRYKPLQAKPGLLVWTSAHSSYDWWGWPGPVVFDAAAGAPAFARGIVGDALVRPWFGGSGHMIAVDTTSDAIVSEVYLSGNEAWWNFGEAYAINGLVYTSHSVSEYDPTIDPPPYTWESREGTKIVTITNDPPPGVWVERHYLDVVNFNEPAEPVVRKPVNIPGSLIGIDRNGELIYTRSYDLRGGESLAAASYDGLDARLVDTLPLSTQWPRPTLVHAGAIYLGVTSTNNADGSMEVWNLSSAGKFERVHHLEMEAPVNGFAVFHDLLVAQSSVLSLFDVANPLEPRTAGAGWVNSCYGAQLNAGDGNAERGLWLPMGWYGVVHIPVHSPATESGN